MAFPIIIVAPSGTGKTTICKHILKKLPNIKYSISATTRRPRKNEKDGKDYYFLSRETFYKWIKMGKFCEWAEVYNELYGTPKEFLVHHLKDGCHVLLDIDIQGAKAVKDKYPEAVTIFILPPSTSELRNRLMERNKDSLAEINKRLKLAESEISHLKEFDYVVVNDEILTTVEKVRAIIIAEECKVSRL
jgi:guanylate kinase